MVAIVSDQSIAARVRAFVDYRRIYGLSACPFEQLVLVDRVLAVVFAGAGRPVERDGDDHALARFEQLQCEVARVFQMLENLEAQNQIVFFLRREGEEVLLDSANGGR